MSGGQKKNVSILGPKLSDSKAQQYYGDKTRQICVQLVDYFDLNGQMSPVTALTLWFELINDSSNEGHTRREVSLCWLYSQVREPTLPPLTFLQADEQDRRPSLAELQSEDTDRRPSITMYQSVDNQHPDVIAIQKLVERMKFGEIEVDSSLQ